MKLAFLAVSYTPQRDGVSVYTENLLYELVREARRRELPLQMDVFVRRSSRMLLRRIIEVDEEGAPPKDTSVRLEFVDIGGDGAFARYVRAPAMMALRRRYDWILMPNFQPLGWWPRAGRLSVLHDLTYRVAPDQFSKLRMLYMGLLTWLRLTLDSDTAIISRTTQDNLTHYYPKSQQKNLLYMPNGLPRKLLHQPRLRSRDVEHKLTAAHMHLLFVGRVNRLKGFDRVHAACSALDRYLQEAPDRRATLHVVGKETGESADLLREFRLRRIVLKCHGYVDDDTLNCLYAESAFCFFLSRNEGFGLPLIEAIWFGCVPILSDIAIFREIMGREFPLFPEGARAPAAVADFIAAVSTDARERERLLTGMEQALERNRGGYRVAARAFLDRVRISAP